MHELRNLATKQNLHHLNEDFAIVVEGAGFFYFQLGQLVDLVTCAKASKGSAFEVQKEKLEAEPQADRLYQITRSWLVLPVPTANRVAAETTRCSP